jgi:hypothetical protein
VGTVALAATTALSNGGRGPFVFKKSQLFCMNSDEDKLYMKIIVFDEIYNFVDQTFFIGNHIQTQIINIPSRSQLLVSRSG